MDTLIAYQKNKKAIADGEPMKFMDFHYLWELIHDKKPREVHIGLKDDEEWTEGCIIENYEWIVPWNYFVHSMWAIPYATFIYDSMDEEYFELTTIHQQYDIEYYENDGKIPLCKLYEQYCMEKYDCNAYNVE